MRLVFERDAAVAEWVIERIPHADGGTMPAFHAIGVADDAGLVAGVIYSGFTEGNCEVSFAASSPRWAQRGVIRALLHYPLVQLGLRRVTAVIPHDNARAIRFNKGIGFRQEGTLRHWFGPRQHGVVLSFLAQDYARLFRKELVHG